MNKYLGLCLMFTFLLLNVTIGQKSQDPAEMIEQAKRQIANDEDTDPATKKMLLDMMNSKQVKKSVKLMEDPDRKMMEDMKTEIPLTSLPKPDPRRIAQIPEKPLTQEQLHTFISSISSVIQKQLPAEDRENVARIISQAKGSSIYLSTKAVSDWYSVNALEALALVSKAALLPGNVNALNNLGAMLNLCGYEEKSVPILQYALKLDSTNASVLNNLGRAYLGLGEKKQAEKMYLRCLLHAPDHPEANNSLGCLYEEAGYRAKAEAHFEKSLQGAYNENAYRHLSKLNPDFDLAKLMAKHYKAPAYFNQYSIKIPPECTNVDDLAKSRADHGAFEDAMARLSGDYSVLANQAEIKLANETKADRQTLLKSLQTGRSLKVVVSPFSVAAERMVETLSKNFLTEKRLAVKDYNLQLKVLLENYHQSDTSITRKYKALKDACIFEGEGGRNEVAKWNRLAKEECAAHKELANKTQNDAATLHTTFKNRYHRLLLDYFNDSFYWRSHVSYNHTMQDMDFYNMVNDFIKELSYLSSTTPFVNYTGCNPPGEKPFVKSENYVADKKPFCPFSVSIPLLIGKLSFDCTTFSISGGEVVKATYNKDFVSGQSTISIGAGLTIEAGVASLDADQSMYVTFDNQGKPSDAGLKFDAGGNIHIAGASTGSGAGYTMGMNSGWDFTANAAGRSVQL